VNDVVAEHNANKAKPPAGWRGSVINMSIGWVGVETTDIQTALQKANAAGIPIAAAVGNKNKKFIEIPAR
jgi:hypothetical protein